MGGKAFTLSEQVSLVQGQGPEFLLTKQSKLLHVYVCAFSYYVQAHVCEGYLCCVIP